MARTRDEDAAHRILIATQKMIAERGPASATISEIATAAQVGRQTIYRWWPSRGHLVIDALIGLTDAAMPFRSTGDTLADLRRQMRAMVKAFAGAPGALIKELLAEAQRDPVIAAAFRDRFFEHRREQAREVIAKAVGDGLFVSTDDQDSLIYALYAPLWLALIVGHETLSPKLADRALDALLRQASGPLP